ncbi:MAG: UDP-glucose 4-epimerase [Bryobacterales bacterium]|jgi:UDP-arabinose 4-epimerase|nr:UDP-glucose 4-epimerase [Bryobacterales bacterium]
MKSILLTGGAGYIGSHTAKALAAAGHLPVALDNLTTGNRWAVKWGPLVEGDIADTALVRRTVEAYRIEAVIHFAARAYVGESNVVPNEYFTNNVVGSLGLFQALVDCGVRNVVFSSSCATYGHQTTPLLTEEHPQIPVNPYGDSKLFAEKALKWYEPAFGLRSVWLRYFNAAGADPGLETGECHDPETHLIPLALRASMQADAHLDVYGSDYPTPDGSCIRDYIHVMDLASAHIRALEYLLRGGPTVGLNLGTGAGSSVKDVIAMAERVTGLPVKARFRERRPGDPPSLVADASKARRVLDWQPAMSDLRTIMDTAFRWHSTRGFRSANRESRTVAA